MYYAYMYYIHPQLQTYQTGIWTLEDVLERPIIGSSVSQTFPDRKNPVNHNSVNWNLIISKYEYVSIVTLSVRVIVKEIKQNNNFLRIYHIKLWWMKMITCIWFDMKPIYNCYHLCQGKNNVIEYAVLSVLQVNL